MLRKLLLLLTPVVVAFGCAGASPFTGSTPYVGSYSGAWTCPANGHTGTMTLSISSTAGLIGTYVDTTSNVSGAISGAIQQNGSFSATVNMSPSPNEKMSGQLSVTSPGSAGAVLSGNATVGTQGIVFTLPADTAAGTSPYAGSFTGNWRSSTNGHYGTLALTVSNGANIQGSIVDAIAGTTGTIAGAVTQTGAFTSTVTYGSGTEPFSGQLSVNDGVLSGNGNLTSGSSQVAITFTLPTASATTSTYAGSFTGPWNSATNNHSGQISWTISPSATILGTFIDTTAGLAGSISGTVDTSGNITATILIGAKTTYTLTGQVTLTSSALSGNATLNNGVAETMTFSLPTTPIVSTYQGTFSGSYGTQPFIGTGIVWTVGPNGSIVGQFTDPNLNLDTLYGSVDNNGNVTLKAINGGNTVYTIGGLMTYQVLEPPTGSDASPEGNEVGEGTITASGGTSQPFSFNLIGTINNVTSAVRRKPAASTTAASPAVVRSSARSARH